MSFKTQLTDVMKTTVPIVCLILLLNIFVADGDLTSCAQLLLCSVLMIIGFAIFLSGVNLGVIPMGVAIGSEIPRRRSLLFMIAVVFIISFTVTVAEPDVNMFSNKVSSAYEVIDKTALVLAIALGVAISLVIAALRIVKQFPIRILITCGYAIILALAIISPPEFLGIGFDSGGVTTGPVTVPVLIAIGMGLCYVISSKNRMDSFGMVGIASIGPIIAVLVYGMISDTGSAANTVVEMAESDGFDLLAVLNEVQYSVLVSVTPLYILFIIFQKFFLKYSWRDFKLMTIGVLMAMIGMIMFLCGVYAGFMPVAELVGKSLVSTEGAIAIFAVGAILGLLVVVAEPAVKILGEQVESVSCGTISKKVITAFTAGGVALLVGLGFLMLVLEMNMIYFMAIAYLVAILAMWFMDDDLVGIAYDAGGVATGPMAVAIIMTMFVGMSEAFYGPGAESIIHGFGIIAMVALAPVISLTVLGIIVKFKKSNAKKKECE